MTDTVLPDRLSTNPKSPYYDEALLQRGIGIKFDGQEKTNIEEYCVSEGWIRVAVGKTVDRKGNPLTIKLTGTVEPYLEKPCPTTLCLFVGLPRGPRSGRRIAPSGRGRPSLASRHKGRRR